MTTSGVGHPRAESRAVGASGWSHRVPYQTDVQAALDALRADVFARGEFEKMWEQFPDMVDDLAAEVD